MNLYLLFARCFASWKRLKIYMSILIVFNIVLIIVTATTSIPSKGDLGHIIYSSGTNYSRWESQICKQSPYKYLQPFTFQFTSSKLSSDEITQCGWSDVNNIVHYTSLSYNVILILLLFIKTPISLFARLFIGIGSLMTFISFIMDASSLNKGLSFCSNYFENTTLGTDLSKASFTLDCNYTDSFDAVVAMLMINACCLVILHTAWGLTPDLYIEPKETDTAKTMKGVKANKK